MPFSTSSCVLFNLNNDSFHNLTIIFTGTHFLSLWPIIKRNDLMEIFGIFDRVVQFVLLRRRRGGGGKRC